MKENILTFKIILTGKLFRLIARIDALEYLNQLSLFRKSLQPMKRRNRIRSLFRLNFGFIISSRLVPINNQFILNELQLSGLFRKKIVDSFECRKLYRRQLLELSDGTEKFGIQAAQLCDNND